MPVTRDQPAPYAPASAILGLINRHRTKGLPSPVDGEVLVRAGISESLIPRTLSAMQSMDLIDGDGKPSLVLEGIRLAPESEYKQRLKEWLTAAYADALAYVDPSSDDETKIRDAFRSYNPVGQQSRMVTLFVGLFAGAGIAPERQKSAPRKTSSAKNGTIRSPAKAQRKLLRNDETPGTDTHGRAHIPNQPLSGNQLPPALAGLLASLPAIGSGWPKTDRDRFLQTFGAVLDFCFPINSKREQEAKLKDEKEDDGE
jgi:Family of unknown function (DUF5343)